MKGQGGWRGCYDSARRSPGWILQIMALGMRGQGAWRGCGGTVPRTPATTAKKNGDPSMASITISNGKVPEAVDESQEQKLRLLLEYKQEHGHVHVPQTHVFKTGETGHFLTLWRVRVCCD